MLQRMREMALQSLNGSMGKQERIALQEEVSALKDEINRIAETTSFGGKKLLNGSMDNTAIQAGAEAGEAMKLSLDSLRSSEQANTVFTATQAMSAGWTVPTSNFAVNHGNQIVITKFEVPNPAGSTLNDTINTPYAVTFEAEEFDRAHENTPGSNFYHMGFYPFNQWNRPGGVDISAAGFQLTGPSFSDETFVGHIQDGPPPESLPEALEFDTALTQGLYRAEVRFKGVGGDHQFNLSMEGTTTSSTHNITTNGWEYADLGTRSVTTEQPTFRLEYPTDYMPGGGMLFKAIDKIRFTPLDETTQDTLELDSVTYQASQGATLGEVVDGLNAMQNSSFSSPNVTDVTFSVTNDYRLKAEMNSEAGTHSELRIAGNLATLMGDYDEHGLVMTARTDGSYQDIDISTLAGAQDAIAAIDSTLERLDAQRADIAAMENRIGHTLNSLETNKINITGANGKILDTQIGKETVSMSKMAMLQNATMTMLGQANNLPLNALQLLR